MLNLYLVLLSLLMLTVVGCERHDAFSPTVKVNLASIPSDQCIVRVNGQMVTAGDFRARRALELLVFEAKNGKKPNFEELEKRFAASRSGYILPTLINTLLIKEYLMKTAGSTSISNETACIQAAIRNLGFRMELSELAEKVGTSTEFLRDQLLYAEMGRRAALQFDRSAESVSEHEIDEGLARQTRYYEQALATNALAYAACSNALSKVRAGEDFATVGLKMSAYEPQEAVKWEEFEPHELDGDESLKQWAFKAPVGSVGGPFELDDGLSLVKILSRQNGTMEPSVVSECLASVSLARMTWNLAIPEPEPRTRDFVRKSLLKWKVNQAQKFLFEKLHREIVLGYPIGTNFVFEIEHQKGKVR